MAWEFKKIEDKVLLSFEFCKTYWNNILFEDLVVLNFVFGSEMQKIMPGV